MVDFMNPIKSFELNTTVSHLFGALAFFIQICIRNSNNLLDRRLGHQYCRYKYFLPTYKTGVTMGLIPFHTKTDENLLALTLSVCLMFAAAGALMLSAYVKSVSSFRMIPDLGLAAITMVLVLWISVVVIWLVILWFLGIYFTKLPYQIAESGKKRVFLLALFFTCGIVSCWMGQHLRIGYGWLFVISTVLMVTAAASFQWAMNEDP